MTDSPLDKMPNEISWDQVWSFALQILSGRNALRKCVPSAMQDGGIRPKRSIAAFIHLCQARSGKKTPEWATELTAIRAAAEKAWTSMHNQKNWPAAAVCHAVLHLVIGMLKFSPWSAGAGWLYRLHGKESMQTLPDVYQAVLRFMDNAAEAELQRIRARSDQDTPPDELIIDRQLEQYARLLRNCRPPHNS